MALAGKSARTLTVSTTEQFRIIGITSNYTATGSVFIMPIPAIVFMIFRKYLVKGLLFGAVR